MRQAQSVSYTLVLLAADFTVVSKCREVKPIKQKTDLVGSSNTASTCRMPSSQCRIIKLKSPQKTECSSVTVVGK